MSSFNLNKRVKINFYQPLPEFSKNFTLQLCSLTLFLLIVSNTSILNPGPTTNASGLNIFFRNIQGLMTFSSLGKPYPYLNQTKISELQALILSTSPDIIILNEIWLKATVNSNEVIPSNIYKTVRLDRSTSSHPVDFTNPRKFRKNGGGVLISVKNSLNLNPKIIKLTCVAEVLSLELTLPNKKKISYQLFTVLVRLDTIIIYNLKSTITPYSHAKSINISISLVTLTSILLIGSEIFQGMPHIPSFLISSIF